MSMEAARPRGGLSRGSAALMQDPATGTPGSTLLQERNRLILRAPDALSLVNLRRRFGLNSGRRPFKADVSTADGYF